MPCPGGIFPSMKCKNCAFSFIGKFCPQCGQSERVRRYQFNYFLRESFFSSLDIEESMKGTAVELLRKPGKVIQDYLGGKRLLLYSPAKFLFLVGALVTVLMLRYNPYAVVDQDEGNIMDSIGIRFPLFHRWYQLNFENFWGFAGEYNTLLNALSVPTFALYSYLFFLNKNYNYTENLILNMYIVSIQLLLSVPFIIVLEFDFINLFKGEILGFLALFCVGYNIWVYVCFFDTSWAGFFLSSAVNGCAYASHVVLMHAFYLLLHLFNVVA